MPDAETTRRLIEALSVRRNAAIGFGLGFLLAAFAYAYRVFELGGPVRARWGSPELFALLAFVLAISAGAFVTSLLVLRSAIGLARKGNDRSS